MELPVVAGRRLFAGAWLAAGLCLAAVPSHATDLCHATDGDTLRCGGERIRIMGLDAPELRGECPREIALARRATERMQGLAMGGLDIERHGRDRYRRVLAVVRDRHGRNVAHLMIREGYARENHGERRRGWCAP